MSAFFRDAHNHMTIDGMPLDRLMAEFGSPLYVYSGAGLERAFAAFQTAVAPVAGKVHFALKANSALGVIALLARCGQGLTLFQLVNWRGHWRRYRGKRRGVFRRWKTPGGHPHGTCRWHWPDQCRIG